MGEIHQPLASKSKLGRACFFQAFPVSSSPRATLKILQAFILMQTDTRMERWCIHYPHLSATNPAQFHAFRTNSRQRATGRGSISQYPMPNSRQLGSRIISFIRSALAKENIPMPCGMRSLKGRDYVLNYTPRGVDPRSDALRPGKQ